MNTLITFEDKYGMADIVCHNMLGILIDTNDSYYSDDKLNLAIKSQLSTNDIFKTQPEATPDTKNLIIVFDMDKQLKQNLQENILDPSYFKTIGEKLKNDYKNKGNDNLNIYYVPTAFCSESIVLYYMSYFMEDFSMTFNSKNTAHMLSKIVNDILIYKHQDTDDKTFWQNAKNNKYQLKHKQTRLFFEDMYLTTKQMIKLLKLLDYGRFNNALIRWLNSGNIKDTSNLLSLDDAHQLLIEYYTEYKQSLNNQRDIQIVNRVYNLDYDYKNSFKVTINDIHNIINELSQ